MFDCDDLEDKPNMVEGLAEKLRLAFSERSKLGVMSCLGENSKDVMSLNSREWVLLKAEIDSFCKIRQTDLEAFRKPLLSEVVTGHEDEKAVEKLGRVYCMQSGKAYVYFLREGKFLRPIPQQEMTPLVEIASGEDKFKRSLIYEKIHREYLIDSMENHIMPSGSTYYEVIKQSNGHWKSVCHVSIMEMLENQLTGMKDYGMRDDFKDLIENHFAHMVHIYEYALALKFCFEKSNCIYMRENSDSGKTFFLGAREAKDYIFLASGEIKEDELKGDGPEKWGKKLFFFVDEAKSYTSRMKNPIMAYRMNYGGRVELDTPLIVLSCDNAIGDLEDGVDRQIENRVISMHNNSSVGFRDWLEKNNMDATTAQMMWQKYILTHVKNMLESWNTSEDLQRLASEKVKWFKKTYKTSGLTRIEDSVLKALKEVVLSVVDKDGLFTKQYTKGVRDFRDFLVATKPEYEDEVLIKSPKKFFTMVVEELMPDKLKAFSKRCPNNEAIAEMLGSEYRSSRKAVSGVVKSISVKIHGLDAYVSEVN